MGTERNGIVKSTDGGATWTRHRTGMRHAGGGYPEIWDIAIAAIEGGVPSFSHGDASIDAYYDGGIFRTVDGGDNWHPAVLGPMANKNGFWIMRVVAGEPTTLLTFGMNYHDLSENLGFLKSIDAGQSWIPMGGDQLKGLFILSFDVSNDGRIIYANVRDSYFLWFTKALMPALLSIWSRTFASTFLTPLLRTVH